ncbi:MAG: DUF5691 domain-containing protein [Pseudomonadota bacterium]
MTPDAILSALLQGTGRRPLAPTGTLAEGVETADPATPARLMTLAVQAQSFDLPDSPVSFDEISIRPDSRVIVPPAVRKQLIRFLTGKGNPADDLAANAVAYSIARRGMRLHPFDLPRLATFVSKHAEILGIRKDQSADTGSDADYWSDSALDESNWTLATPAAKANFIAELRRDDAAKARALVEAQFPLEKAPVRVRLVDAMATGLSGDDRAFLESVAGDRAPKVKAAVTRLLAHLPGTGAAQEQIDEIISRIKLGRTGLLIKRTTLKLEMPANMRSRDAQTEWLALNFGSIAPAGLADALDMSTAQLLDAARDNDALVRGIAFAACAERDWALLENIALDHANDIWTEFLTVGLGAFGLVGESDKQDWVEATIPKRWARDSVDPHHLIELYEALGAPLPLSRARAAWKAAAEARHSKTEAFSAAIALTPPRGLPEALRTIADEPPQTALRAQKLAEILILLDEGQPTQ